MEPVDRRAAAGLFRSLHGRAVESIRECVVPEPPRSKKVILGARALDGRSRLAIDEEHVIAFTPPVILVLQNGHGDAHEMAAPGGFHPNIVAFAAQVLA